MTPQEIRAAIAASPELTALAQAPNRNDEAIAAALSVGRTRIVQPYLIGDGTVANLLGADGPGPVFVYTLMLAASAPLPESPTPQQVTQQALVWQAWRRLSSGNLDIGLPGVRAQIDAMVGKLPGLTQAGADAIKALAVQPDPISPAAVSAALNEGGI